VTGVQTCALPIDWLLIPYNLPAFVLPFLAYWPFSTGYYYLVQSKAISAENRRLRHETMLLSQRWLKAELNPHFMNNCYHFLDGLDRKSTRLNSSHVKISY